MSEAPLLSEARSSAIPIQVASTVDPPCPTAVSPLVSPLTHGDIDKLMHKRPRSAPNGAFPPPTVDGAESAARTHRSFASRIQEALGEGNWGFQPRRSYHNAAAPKPLAILPLVALIFYEVSGGPFGTEDAVRAGSPFVALLAFAIFPLIWSIPEALVCAEMATIFPENSGYVAWVTAAFGPFWGWMEGFWSWVSGVTDNSVYPVLFMSYLETAFPALQSGPWRIAALVSFNVALTYMNWRGLTLVGRTAILLTAFTIAPFLVMGLLALPRISPANWLRADWAHVDWPDMLNIVFWNLNYWDSASTLAGEVQNPGVTFPRAIGGAVVLVVAMYLLPMLVGLGLPTRQQDWTEGYYAVVAGTVGGQWLAGWVIAAAAVSNVGQFQAEMSSDSFQLLGMAERGFLPAVFAKRSRHGTPTLGVLLSSLGIVAMLTLDFTAIVELLNAIYCFAELLEFAAFVHLRYKHPHLHRPYRVPLPNWAVVLLLLPASALLCFIIGDATAAHSCIHCCRCVPRYPSHAIAPTTGPIPHPRSTSPLPFQSARCPTPSPPFHPPQPFPFGTAAGASSSTVASPPPSALCSTHWGNTPSERGGSRTWQTRPGEWRTWWGQRPRTLRMSMMTSGRRPRSRLRTAREVTWRGRGCWGMPGVACGMGGRGWRVPGGAEGRGRPGAAGRAGGRYRWRGLRSDRCWGRRRRGIDGGCGCRTRDEGRRWVMACACMGDCV